MLLPWKGQPVFLRAAQLILERRRDARAIIHRRPTPRREAYAGELQDLARELGIDDHVIFTGFRSDLARLLPGLDVVDHPSVESEPFSCVIVEAMAMKCPVVASAAGGPLELIEDRRSGLLVPPGDHEALAARVIELLDNSKLAAPIAEHGYRKAGTRFSAETHTHLVQQVHDQALESLEPEVAADPVADGVAAEATRQGAGGE